MVALAGLVAALAPWAEWFRLDVELNDVTTAVGTNGWGTVSIDAPFPIPDAPANTWGDWTLAGIPDGAVASLVAAVIVVAGLRVLLTGVRSGRTAAAIGTAAGLAGLVWMAASWLTTRALVRDYEDLFTEAGMPEQMVRERLSGHTGPGFGVAAVAFGAAAVAGLAALVSGMDWTPSPTANGAASGSTPAEPGTAPVPAGPGDRPMPSWDPPLPPVPPAVADALGPPAGDAPRSDGPPPSAPPSPLGWR